jgi:hypothetical protein
MKKLILAMAFVLAAAPALAYEPVPEPDTIYDPNVPPPSYDDVQSLRILQPDYGLREELHLSQPWNQLFENGWLDRQQGN